MVARVSPQLSMTRIPGRRLRRLLGCVLLLVLVALITTCGSGLLPRDGMAGRPNSQISKSAADYFSLPYHHEKEGGDAAAEDHPIDWLIHEARATHEERLQRRSTTLSDAAWRYRERRGRHPPPGFDLWFRHAIQTDSVVVEDFFDRIYQDLRPFWAVAAADLAAQASRRDHVITIRGGHARAFSEGRAEGKGRLGPNAMPQWLDLITEVALHLPDMDVPVNSMDEPRVLVPWHDMAELVRTESITRTMPHRDDVITDAQRATVGSSAGPPLAVQWEDESWRSYWDLIRDACSPDSPSTGVESDPTMFESPPKLPYTWDAPYGHRGYVLNASAAADPCVQPHLRALHSAFVEPRNVNTTTEPLPVFSSGKLRVNNDILFPSPVYLAEDVSAASIAELTGVDWRNKQDRLVFRGVGSGGRGRDSPWRRFHRNRLVEMLNGTAVHAAETGGTGRAQTFDLPEDDQFGTERRFEEGRGAWLSDFASAGFDLFMCGDGQGFSREPCANLADHVGTDLTAGRGGNRGGGGGGGNGAAPTMSDFYAKFLPVVDRERGAGGVAARFRTVLLSTSLPLKATVYAEWHDDRLTPWLHFVPLDNSFRDLYAVLDYFTDGDGRSEPRGDMAARWIAESGRDWAAKVLRKEDMRLYVWRLLLEWGRLCDEDRDYLGFVEDL